MPALHRARRALVHGFNVRCWKFAHSEAGRVTDVGKKDAGFINRIGPAPVGGGYAMEGFWVWCGSVIRGEDAKYHMFASRWPNSYPFFEGYPTNSEIVRAVSATPEGPYVFDEVVLAARGSHHWDGRMTHNPTIHKWRDTYLLFYIGSTFTGPSPTPREIVDAGPFGSHPQTRESYGNIRIGLATAKSVAGPWTRMDQPVLSPRPGKWDASIVTNPAVCVCTDERILLLYRSNAPQGLRIGAAVADSLHSPFRRLADEPVLRFEGDNEVEDPCVWQVQDHFELLAKDISGGLTGETHAGVHATSPDGVSWTLSHPAKAYSRRVKWNDGTTTVQGCVERPKLLIEDGRPTHLFAATGDGLGGFVNCSRTWNMVMPLE